MRIMFFWDDAVSYPRRRKSSTTAVTTQNSRKPGNMNDVHISCKIMIMPELEYSKSLLLLEIPAMSRSVS
jgi:hypothetical protein